MRKRRINDDGQVRCTACGEYKAPTEFTPDRSRPSGYKLHCKPCRQRLRGDKNHACVGCGAERRHNKWYCPSCWVTYRAKSYARLAVRQAVALGCFPEGEYCSKCGASENVELHHVSGFAHLRDWLNVVPLCRDCHQLEHAAQRLNARAPLPKRSPAVL